MDDELTRFFAGWVPVLQGQRGADDLRTLLGTPQGTAEEPRSCANNLGFYRTLMERNAANILCQLFPVTRAAFVAWAPGQWSPLLASYARERPARSYLPNEFGRNFPEFVQNAAYLVLAELADYEWLSYAFGAGVPAEANGAPVERYSIRHYEHDIPGLIAALRAGEVAAPRSAPVTVLFHLDPDTQHASALHPSRAALLALARRAGVTVDMAHVTSAQVDAAERDLEARGVLAATPGVPWAAP